MQGKALEKKILVFFDFFPTQQYDNSNAKK